MKSVFKTFILLIILSSLSFSQEQCTIMSYNILNYPAIDPAIRNPYFRTIIQNTEPDILVVQEILSQAGVNNYLDNVLNIASSGYAAGIFIDGFDTDNAIFYKTNKFIFISNRPILTELRNISEFTLVNISTSDTIRIYSLHLKASSGSSNEEQRAREVDSLRKVTDALPPNSDFLILGDFNIYYSNEPAFQKLLNQSSVGYVLDPINRPGTWNNNIAFADIHTQSPRTRLFGGGSTGGMDDRFDMILVSQAIKDPGGISFVNGSYTSYGNDSFHFNDSINNPPNLVVSQQIADALHYSSDHIPVLASFSFEQNTTQIAVNLIDGWNILSVPLLAPDMSASVLFPTAISPFSTFNNGYYEVNVLDNGKGYWAKFNGSQSVIIKGSLVSTNSIDINQGWNMIGPFDTQIPVNSITTTPPNILASPFWDYNNGYYETTILQPGKGYWVKTSSPGILLLNIIP